MSGAALNPIARRPVLVAGAVGVVALAGGAVVASSGGAVMPSYLAAWLFWLALPVGALPLLMGFELSGAAAAPAVPALRRLLWLLPLAALFAIPVLLRLGALYPWHAAPLAGFAGQWFRPRRFIIRAVVFLLVWAALALVFARPSRRSPAGRRGLAAFGLLLHLVVGTLAAIDWVLSVDPDINSSEFGLLMIVTQAGIALCAAVLLERGGRTQAASRQFATLLLALVSAWAFLHFMQYLVIWSANKPSEVTWYIRRGAGLGQAAEWFLAAALVLTLVALIPDRLARRAGVVAGLAGLLLLAHLIEALWLVTPASRGAFSLSAADGLAMVGLGGIALALLLALHSTEADARARV